MSGRERGGRSRSRWNNGDDDMDISDEERKTRSSVGGPSIREGIVFNHSNYYQFIAKWTHNISPKLDRAHVNISERVTEATPLEKERINLPLHQKMSLLHCDLTIKGLPPSVFFGSGYGEERKFAYFAAAKDLMDKCLKSGLITRDLHEAIGAQPDLDMGRRLPDFVRAIDLVVYLISRLPQVQWMEDVLTARMPCSNDFVQLDRLIAEAREKVYGVDAPVYDESFCALCKRKTHTETCPYGMEEKRILKLRREQEERDLKRISGGGDRRGGRSDSRERREKKEAERLEIERNIIAQREALMREDEERKMKEAAERARAAALAFGGGAIPNVGGPGAAPLVTPGLSGNANPVGMMMGGGGGPAGYWNGPGGPMGAGMGGPGGPMGHGGQFGGPGGPMGPGGQFGGPMGPGGQYGGPMGPGGQFGGPGGPMGQGMGGPMVPGGAMGGPGGPMRGAPSDEMAAQMARYEMGGSFGGGPSPMAPQKESVIPSGYAAHVMQLEGQRMGMREREREEEERKREEERRMKMEAEMRAEMERKLSEEIEAKRREMEAELAQRFAPREARRIGGDMGAVMGAYGVVSPPAAAASPAVVPQQQMNPYGVATNPYAQSQPQPVGFGVQPASMGLGGGFGAPPNPFAAAGAAMQPVQQMQQPRSVQTYPEFMEITNLVSENKGLLENLHFCQDPTINSHPVLGSLKRMTSDNMTQMELRMLKEEVTDFLNMLKRRVEEGRKKTETQERMERRMDDRDRERERDRGRDSRERRDSRRDDDRRRRRSRSRSYEIRIRDDRRSRDRGDRRDDRREDRRGEEKKKEIEQPEVIIQVGTTKFRQLRAKDAGGLKKDDLVVAQDLKSGGWSTAKVHKVMDGRVLLNVGNATWKKDFNEVYQPIIE